jgi:adenine-specific DNA-methyltransferase
MDINAMAFSDTLRITQNNLETKHLIITNINEWFIFDATTFDRLFAQNKKLVKQFNDFEDGRLADTKTDFFYKQVAEPFIADIKTEIEFTHFNLQDYQKPLRNDDKKDDNKLIALFKLLSPEHLLKLPFTNDSNSLDKRFYSELLHIIGLTETKEGTKKLIQRNETGKRNTGTILEDAIIQLDSLDKISRLERPSQFGSTQQERLFNVGLELSITWINRILFLKLMEAQLITYHKGDTSFSFLNLHKIKSYDDLNSLFFQVLARKYDERNEDVIKIFEKVPYLNSSLFEPTDIEQDTLFISNLRDDKTIPIISSTVLKDQQGKKRTGKLNTLEYLFEFLNAYDFSSEGSEEIQEENKSLINASVLGLIFEKINGYKDGSFFTPGFITMYMCRETIRKAVVQKFNETKKWKCRNLEDLYDKIEDRKEANEIINSLKLCDPAVGSGHFLVSALNEIIAVKNDLKLLQDRDGKRLKEYEVEVVNDELIVTDEEGELFEYNPKSKESQRIQETLFHEKQTIIENCLFGVDINPNSVKICRLRLWIELLKNAYYKNETELETLPNIDINIKCGNSLVSRFDIDADLKQALKKSKWSIDSYRAAVSTYRNAESKAQKREMEKLIADIKSDFRSEISLNDPKVKRLRKLSGELFKLTQQQQLFEMSKKEKTAWNKKVQQLTEQTNKLEAEIEEIKANKIFENAFEWRFEFPEVLNSDGDFVGFDVVIGNPPYLNFKMYDSFTRSYLSGRYQKIYDGKSDIYYFFFYHGIEILKPNGIFSNITSRYWLEAEFAEKLRNHIASDSTLTEIVDFKNVTIFDGVGIKTAILSLTNAFPKTDSQFSYRSIDSKKITEVDLEKYDNIHVSNTALIGQKAWILRNEVESKLLLKIKAKGQLLESIAECKQGIVTGRDKAFVDSKGAFEYLPKNLVKEWVKVGDIQQYAIVPVEERELVYSNNIEDLDKFPELEKRLLNFKDKLENRREVRNGVIRWFDLQWSRTNELFDSPKIICRFKAPKNTFAIDTNGTYSSADTTIVKLLDKWSDKLDLYYLVAVLNSKVLDYYFKSYGKLMDYRYEYYPGPVGLLPIVIDNEITKISELSKKTSDLKKSDADADTSELEKQINDLVYALYDLTKEEIEFIENA